MTYKKREVLEAANAAAQHARASRKERLQEYDARGLVHRFFAAALGPGRPIHHLLYEQKVAERVSLKATFCVEDLMTLSDEELVVLAPYYRTLN
jgi:hypothetical protein